MLSCGNRKRLDTTEDGKLLRENPLMIKKEPSDIAKDIQPVLFPSSARKGFLHLLQHIAAPKSKAILLPSYVGYSSREGSGVHDPIEACGIDFDFYRVNSKLSADLDDITKKLVSGRYFALLVIHYFGIVQSDLSTLKQLCKKFNVYLIEDCAHTLSTKHCEVPVGHWGDFAIYSIHKILPIHDGGILRNNRDDVKLPPLPKSVRMDWSSLEFYTKVDLSTISKTMLNNYIYLADAIIDMKGITVLYPKLPEGNIPMNFPILITSTTRHDVYTGLQSRKVQTTALYYKLIDSISDKEYPVSHRVSRQILNLPIHQDMSREDLNFLVTALHDVVNNV